MVVHDEACKQCGEFLAYANAKTLPEVMDRLDSLAYREHAARHALEQGQAWAKQLYDVVTAVRTGLDGSHRELGAECGESPCTLCWLLGEAEDALAAFAKGADDAQSP